MCDSQRICFISWRRITDQCLGDSELNLKLKVSPEGTILIPNLGPVSVSGLTIETAENRIRQELGRIMSTLSGDTDGLIRLFPLA